MMKLCSRIPTNYSSVSKRLLETHKSELELPRRFCADLLAVRVITEMPDSKKSWSALCLTHIIVYSNAVS